MDNDVTVLSGPTGPTYSTRATVFGPPPVRPSIGGRIVEGITDLPLAGVPVQWVTGGDDEATSHTSPQILLGQAVSDQDGAFHIVSYLDSPEAGHALCALAWQPEATSYFRLDGGEDGPLMFATVPAPDEDEVVIHVTSTREPNDEQWQALGEYLASNRMIRADDLSRQLMAPLADSPVRAWPLTVRTGALAAVGFALAGNADGTDLLQQVHLLNLDALAGGDVTKAVTNFRDSTTFEQFGGRTSEWLDGSYYSLPKSDLELYRDYLRGVWVVAARPMHAAKGAPMPTDAALALELDTRLHQNFRTADVTSKGAHALLIPILTEVLMARADRDGFGLAAAAVPVRGATQSDAEYVATLVARSGKSAAELRNRFRIHFDRSLADVTSPMALNVEALLGVLADTYQSPEEPFPTALHGVGSERPLIFPQFLGRAPFFLQYDEWLDRQRRFFPENVYDVRRVLPNFFKAWRDVIVVQKTASHALINKNNDYISDAGDWNASAAWLEQQCGISDEIRAALAAADKQAYPAAHGHLDAALKHIEEARRKAPAKWTHSDFVFFNRNGSLPTPATLTIDRHVSLKTRAARPVTTVAQLAEFESYFDTRTEPHVFGFQNGPDDDFNDWQESWLARARTLYINELDYFQFVLVPYLRSTLLMTLGDVAGATRLLGRITGYEVGIAQVTDAAGYLPANTNPPYFYQRDSLPYTTAVAFDSEIHDYTDQTPHKGMWPMEGRQPTTLPLIAPFEHLFFKLAQGEAMLSWADELYRTDDPSSIRRARELYKGVLFMHGVDPGIAPHFKIPGLHPVGGFGGPDGISVSGNALVASQQNPARMSQVARAQAGFGQIELGLNVYGFRDDMVPVLRYRPLKMAADLFAASARASQADFLQYQTRFEQATIEGWQTAAMVKKAQAGAGIAAEQIAIANVGVAKAQEQVAAVKAQIAAKKQEIEDADSFFGQAEDFFGGMKDSLSGLASAGKGVMSDDSAAGSVSGEQLLAMFGKSSGGGAAAKDAMVATLGSGAALTLGFGAFAYYGYTTMSGMADAAAKRTGELQALNNVALPAAEAQVTLKARDVTIARFGQQIAAAELDLARALERFQRERFLNVDVWNKLAAFAQRTMKRYVELGARSAWMAERALAFDGNREINIVGLNYVPTAMRGLTGADRLLLDLAELEANRLNGIRLTVPVKHTLSLARDFPLAFGRLKQAGRCSFHTGERTFQAAYPGTFAYRVRALTVAAHDADGPPPRGMLRNLGASTVSKEDGAAPKLLVRFPDALPLSEFRLHQDLWVYGLPGEALLQFEGSGIETDWELEFPLAANAKGLRSLTDVLITLDMNATYSQALAAKAAALPLPPVARGIALAASVWDPKGLASLRAANGPVRIRFDLSKLALPLAENGRIFANLALLAVGTRALAAGATLEAQTSNVQTAFNFADGIALSNAGPLLGGAAALPLNDLVGLPIEQGLVLELDRAGIEDDLRALDDVVLWLEYDATL
jgi:hypothetical protein